MRVACRRRVPFRLPDLWARLEDPRGWTDLFVAPDAAAPRRVKLLGGGPATGVSLQVLRVDHTWTLYRIERWDAGRQVLLSRRREGRGLEEGAPVAGDQTERLILIPQGRDTEAEWMIERRGALLKRLVGSPGKDAWQEALEARLDSLAALGRPGNRSDSGRADPRPEH